MQIKKIIALGDIHCFKSKRFHEHQNLFNKFYKILEEEKPDLVVIPGDVIDSKVNISPEQVVLLQNLLVNITNYAPIVQILGNHDLNLQNVERKDLISAIINSLKGQTKYPIHFFPHSGIYSAYGINWAVWSCLDNQLNPYSIVDIDANPSGNKYTIGLFHGAVGGCLSDTGMELKDGIDINEFESCDICILSDIHKRQSFRNNDINYTGNFIQVKENEVPHGTYLVYEFDENQGKHIPIVKNIDNEYSTLLFEVTDITELPVFDKIYPEQTIKLSYDQTKISKADILEYKKKLQKEITNKIDYKPLIPKKKLDVVLNDKDLVEEDISKSFKELLKKYLEEQGKNLKNLVNPQTDYESILDLDKLFGGDLSADNAFEPGDFYIEKIIINNLYSFPPEDTEIEIFGIEGINGINGENRAGKSKIIEAIMFTLYESMPKALSASKKIINKHNRSKSAYAEVYLNKAGRRYKIKREISPLSAKNDKVSYVLEFDEINEENLSIQNIRGEKKQETQKKIDKYFGTEETFELLSMYSAQKKQIEFIDCLNAQRLEYINKFMGLQSFEVKFKEASEEFKTKNKFYQELLKDFNDKINIEELEEELKECEARISNLNESNSHYSSSIKDIELNIEGINKEYHHFKLITEKKYDDIEFIDYKIQKEKDKIKSIDDSRSNKPKEIAAVEEKKNKIDGIIKTNNDAIENNNSKVTELKKEGKNYKVQFQKIANSTEEKEILFDLVDINKDEINKLTKSVAILESEISRYEKQLRIDICDNCSKEFSESDKDKTRKLINENQQKVISTNEKINILTEVENSLRELAKKCKVVVTEINKVEENTSSLKFQNSKYESEKANFDVEIQKIENKYLGIDNDITKIQLVISDLEKQKIETEKIIKEIKDAERKLIPLLEKKNPLDVERSNLLNSIGDNNRLIGEKNQKIKQINKDINDYKQQYTVINTKQEEVRLLALYKEIVAKDGLPLFILKTQIGSGNQQINTIINQVFDFDLEFIINEETGELKIEFNYDYDIDKSDVALASGSETFIVNLCIRVGLTQISEIPKCLSLIVDEGFGTLDKKNVDKIPVLFTTLLNYYRNIILISHLDELKEIYTNEINVVKEKYSVIS